MSGKVLLLGGTGAMGLYLGEMLVSKGFDVCVTTRRKRENDNGIRYLMGNGHDVGFVRSILAEEKPDAIVDFMSYSTEEFANRRDILLLGTRHYLFLSSYRVFSGESPVCERTPRLLDTLNDPEYLETDEYALAKAREENLLRESNRCNWTILRPCITYSKNRFQFTCLEANVICFRSMQGLPVVAPAEMLDVKTTLSWGRDVAMLISRLVLNNKAYGEDFNVVTSESHTWREIADIYRKCIGMQIHEVSMSDYCKVCNPYQVKYDRMFNRVMDNRKVLEATGTTQGEFTPLEVGLAHELNEFKRNPVYLNPDVCQNALIDRLCGTRIDLSSFSPKQRLYYWCARYPLFGKTVRFALLPRRILRLRR